MAEPIRSVFIPSWSLTPIPRLSLSAGGLLALADLTSVAERTAIKGGSSWLDAFVLVPGLHYQQAADALDRQSASALSAELGLTEAVEETAGGGARGYVINNVAMVKYLKRLWSQDPAIGVITLSVELSSESRDDDGLKRRLCDVLLLRRRRQERPKQQHKRVTNAVDVDMDTLSHVLYLLSPLLTVAAIVLMVLLEEWWGLGFLIALMISRILNIWVIKERSKLPIADILPLRPSPLPLPGDRLRRRQLYKEAHPHPHQQQHQHQHHHHRHNLPPPALLSDSSRLTEYTIDLSLNRRIVLRGLDADLQAVTTQAWMRSKSSIEGYLEAASKLIVYLVAALSGNLSQAGAIVFMALLLISSGLLGLSNAHSRSLQIHGRRVARLTLDKAKLTALDPPSPPADALAVPVPD